MPTARFSSLDGAKYSRYPHTDGVGLTQEVAYEVARDYATQLRRLGIEVSGQTGRDFRGMLSTAGSSEFTHKERAAVCTAVRQVLREHDARQRAAGWSVSNRGGRSTMAGMGTADEEIQPSGGVSTKTVVVSAAVLTGACWLARTGALGETAKDLASGL